jgi:hypothetical protein
MPAHEAAELAREGLVLFDEGFKGTTTYIKFRAPGRYSNWQRQWYTASAGLTNTRLVAFHYAGKTIDVPFSDERFRGLQFSVEESGALLVAFDASLFHDDWSGALEYRLFTPLARDFLEKLAQKQAS